MKVLHLAPKHSFAECLSSDKIIDNLIKNCRCDASKFQYTDTTELLLYLKDDTSDIWHFHAEINDEQFVSDLKDVLKTKDVKTLRTSHRIFSCKLSECVDKIICIHDECRDLKLYPEKSFVIENTVDVSSFLKHTPNKNGVCISAWLSNYRFGEKARNILSKINSTVFLYGGLKIENVQKNIRRFVTEPNFVNMGWSEEMEKRMVSHAILMNLSEINYPKYCFGLNVMEAVSLGMPVISYPRTQKYQTYIIDGHNGFISDDPNVIVERTNQLLSDNDTYLEMCHNAEEHSRSIENSMPKLYSEIYEKLIF